MLAVATHGATTPVVSSLILSSCVWPAFEAVRLTPRTDDLLTEDAATAAERARLTVLAANTVSSRGVVAGIRDALSAAAGSVSAAIGAAFGVPAPRVPPPAGVAPRAAALQAPKAAGGAAPRPAAPQAQAPVLTRASWGLLREPAQAAASASTFSSEFSKAAPPAPAATAAGAPMTEWACSMCTYINAGGSACCMCESPRPA